MQIDIKDIIKSCNEESNQRNPKCAISIKQEQWTIDVNGENESNTVSKLETGKATINIEEIDAYYKIDLMFSSSYEQDLKVAWNILESYGKNLNKFIKSSEKIPALTMTITPLELKGRYFVSANSPIYWILIPQTKYENVDFCGIRMMFKKDSVDFIETNEIDVYEIEQNVDKHIMEIEETERIEEEKKKENEKYEKLRNERMKELYKNKDY